MTVKPIPDGYHAITPYLIIDGAARAIEFYKAAFGATELFRFPGPDGKIGHAELRIGDSVIMLADEVPERGILGPGRIGGSPVSLMLYVEGVDAVVDRAASHGAVIKRPVACSITSPRRGGMWAVVGAGTGWPFITTEPEAVRCWMSRSAVIRAIMSSAWCTRLRPW